jgi:hypothetical protein
MSRSTTPTRRTSLTLMLSITAPLRPTRSPVPVLVAAQVARLHDVKHDHGGTNSESKFHNLILHHILRQDRREGIDAETHEQWQRHTPQPVETT